MSLTSAEILAQPHDIIICADGSGNNWSQPCGWGAKLIIKSDGQIAKIIDLLGGTSHGTNNYAELAPFIHTLGYHREVFNREGRRIAALCVSDSELTVKCGNGKYFRNSNLFLWQSLDYFVNAGYNLTWLHVKRNTNEFAEYCDGVSKLVREKLGKLSLPQ